MKADSANPVDLLRGPVLRFALFKAAPARFFWYQRYHHVLIDGFGLALFKRRAADIYAALVNKLPCSGNPFGSLAQRIERSAEDCCINAFVLQPPSFPKDSMVTS